MLILAAEYTPVIEIEASAKKTASQLKQELEDAKKESNKLKQQINELKKENAPYEKQKDALQKQIKATQT